MRNWTAVCLGAVVGGAFLSSTALAESFAELTALANGALNGQNVEEAVPGFEIRLLRDGQVLYHQAFGDWSIDRVAEANSSTKNLSGALIMSVAQTGENGFSLDSALADFLPAFDKPGHRDITVRQAFSHTSGLGGLDPTGILGNAAISLQEAAAQIAQRPLTSGPPGSKFSYGGLSMQAAGAAVEVATGQRFVDLMAERITEPLGMLNTHFTIASPDNPRVAGGVESTATDFSRFMDMVLNGGVDRVSGTRVLQPESIAQMLAPQTDSIESVSYSPQANSEYGVGVWLNQLDQAGPAVDYLAGGAKGFHSWIDKAHGLVFTFATDQSSFANVEVLSSLMHRAVLAELLTRGDYNDDGVVDAADYVMWRDNLGAPAGALGNDIDGGMIDTDQYYTWRSNYGAVTLSGAPSTSVTAPEPSTSTALVVGGSSLLLRRRITSVDTREDDYVTNLA